MRPQTVTIGSLATASANNICTAQALGAAGDLTINGSLAASGVATLDTPRRVILTAATSDNSGVTFTVYGTNAIGAAIQASHIGPASGSANVDFGISFATVTRIASSAATVGNVTVGTNTVAESVPIYLNHYANSQTSIQVNVSGTVNYTVMQTLENPNTLGIQNVTWVNHSDTNVVAATTTQQSNYNYLPLCAKIVINSGDGTVKMTMIQSGTPDSS